VLEFQKLETRPVHGAWTKAEFAGAEVPQVDLEARQDLRVTLTLAVASQTQTIEVQAAAEQMATPISPGWRSTPGACLPAPWQL
jgi:hypothetical protein